MKSQALLTEEQEANDILGYQTNILPSLALCANPQNSPHQILSKLSYLFWLHSLGQASKLWTIVFAYTELGNMFKTEIICLYKEVKEVYLRFYSAIKKSHTPSSTFLSLKGRF